MEAALYGEGGFFALGNGPRRDFVTGPEVGSLFGTCVAEWFDRYWRALDEPDPFLVVEAGAGNGRLARDILRAEPECLRALRYVLVERSPALRAEHRTRLPIEPADEALGSFVRRSSDDAPVPATGTGPVFTSLAELPALRATDALLFANELLDNLPFGIAQRSADGWQEVRVALDGSRLTELFVPIEAPRDYDVAVGTRIPIPRGMREWFAQCEHVVRRGRVVFVDYMTDATELRLRTYRGHERGSDPLVDPGSFDITADVLVSQLLSSASAFTLVETSAQAEWLRAAGIEELAAAGKRAWEDGAARGDLAALAGRSRVHEASALTDQGGLGAHRVVVLSR